MKNFKQVLATLALTTLFIALSLAVYSARWILIATLIGIGLGVLISPVPSVLHRRFRIPPGFGVMFCLIGFVIITAGLGYLLFVPVSEQFAPLAKHLPEYAISARQKISELLKSYPWMQRQFESINWGAALRTSAQTLFQGLQLGAIAVGGFFFVLTIALYLATNPAQYLAGFLSLFPAHLRRSVQRVSRVCAKTLRQWFASQLIAMAAVGALTAIGLKIIGVESWLFFGILTGVLDIIPYVGPIIAALGVVIVTLGSDTSQVPWVIAMYVAVQQVEGDLIIPMVMKGRIELPPVHLITLMLILGQSFGILGVFIAPPLLAVSRTIYLMVYVPKVNHAIPEAVFKKSA